MSLRLLLLLFVCCVDADISARLLLRLHCYSHPSNHRSDGSKCDSNTDCDPEFRFCLSSRPQSGYNCDLARLAPLAFEDRSKLGSCAPDTDFPETLTFPLSTEASQLFLTLDIYDIDRSMFTTRKQEIDRLRFQVLPGLRALPNNATPTPEAFQRLLLTNRDFLGEDQPRVELRGVLVCSSGRFGARCESTCAPTERYSCSAEGRRKCKPGWRGERCDQEDPCASNPCKTWAECVPKSGSVYDCVCDGRAGPQCLAGVDPCLDHRCLNNATCVVVETRPECRCWPGWRGRRCEEKDPCWPDVCTPHGRCENGSCVCEVGFSGTRCQMRMSTVRISTTTTLQMLRVTNSGVQTEEESVSAIIIFCILFGFVLVGIATICLMKMVRRRREKYNLRDRESTLTMLHNRNPTSPDVYDVEPDEYDVPGRIYSVRDSTKQELMPQDDDIPPPLPARQNSTISKASSSRVRVDSAVSQSPATRARVDSAASSRRTVRYVRTEA